MSDYNASNVTPWKNSSINNICISEGVESIGSQAFTKCINLKSIEIPSGVTRIGQAAFKNCYNLKDIKIPSGLKYIDLDAFYNCSSLKSITIPKEQPAIGNRTFYGCSSLESIVIPEGVTRIMEAAFYGCSNLKSIEIPKGLTNIDTHAFWGCHSLENITIPENVSSIGSFAFCGCNSLTNINIPEGVSFIRKKTFCNCNNLTTVSVPSSVTTIEESAFEFCSSLTDVYYTGGEENWSSISKSKYNDPLFNATIHYGKGLKIKLEEDQQVKSYTGSEIKPIPIVQDTERKKLINGTDYTLSYSNNIDPGTATITATGLGDYAGQTASVTFEIVSDVKIELDKQYEFFTGTGCLISFDITSKNIIPDSKNVKCTLTPIDGQNGEVSYGDVYILSDNNVHIFKREMTVFEDGKYKLTVSFQGVSAVAEVVSRSWKIENDTLIILSEGAMKDYTEDVHAPWYDKREEIKKITISDSVKHIGDYAFTECTNVKSVDIGNGIKSIGECAFSKCHSLETAPIPNGVLAIKDAAFYNCYNLDEIVIPSSVKDIGINPFAVLAETEASDIKTTAIQVDSNNQYFCSVKGVLYNKNLTKLISYPAGNSRKFFALPETVVTIGEFAFGAVDNLRSIYIPSSLENIEGFVFNEFSGLTTIYYAFSEEQWNSINIGDGNDGLEGFNFFYDVVEVGQCGENLIWLFFKNETLVVAGEGEMYDYLPEDAPWYKYHDIIAQILIEEDVETIGNNSFYDCNTNYVIIPDSVRLIGEQAFGWCEKLIKITIPDNLTNIGKAAFTNCSSLESVDLPGGILRLSEYAFSNCTNIEYVNIPASLIGVETGAFLNCVNLSDVYYAEKQPAWKALVENIKEKNDSLLNAEIHFQINMRIRLKEDTWKFHNLTPEITREDYRKVFKSASDDELDEMVKKDNGSKGTCFGMCITVAASYLGYPPVSSYGSYSELNSVSKGDKSSYTKMSAKELIKIGSIYRFTDIAQQSSSRFLDKSGLTQLYNAIYDYQYNNGPPVIIGACGEIGKKSSAHAVLALGIVSENADKTKIQVYNPNQENKKAYLVLKGKPGNYTEWELDIGWDKLSFVKFNSLQEKSSIEYFKDITGFIQMIRPQVGISEASVSGLLAKTYTGKAITQAPTVKIESITLTPNTDYTLSFENNINAGTATMTITGIGIYEGTKTATFKINKATQSITASNLSLTFSDSGMITASGNKGSLSYKSSNTAIATVDSTGKVTAKGAGKATITITAAATSNYNAATKTITVTVAKKSQSITAKAAATSIAVGETTTVSITGAKGTESFKSSDTSIATVDSKTGTVTAKKVGTVKITATSAATANYNAASKTITIKVVPASIAKATVTCPASKVWAGWALTPVPTVKVGSKTLKKGTDFSLAFTNNKNVGTATITITGKGNYTGMIKKTFKINPKPTSISKLSGGSKKFTIGWKKQPSQTSGYQIQYSSRSDFKTQKIVTVSGASKTSRTVSGLAKKHKYYVRIRTYKTVGKTKYSLTSYKF